MFPFHFIDHFPSYFCGDYRVIKNSMKLFGIRAKFEK